MGRPTVSGSANSQRAGQQSVGWPTASGLANSKQSGLNMSLGAVNQCIQHKSLVSLKRANFRSLRLDAAPELKLVDFDEFCGIVVCSRFMTLN